MSTDPIKYTRPISFDSPTVYPNYESTVQVPGTGNPYLRNPYQDVPSIPPPPPKQGHKWLLVALLILSCLVVILGGTLFAVMLGSSQPGSPQPTPAPQTAFPSARPYDAKAIIHDFQAHGLPLDQLQYGGTINDYVGKDYVTVITLQSSAMFIDPSFCNGPCDVGSVWLGVYSSPQWAGRLQKRRATARYACWNVGRSRSNRTLCAHRRTCYIGVCRDTQERLYLSKKFLLLLSVLRRLLPILANVVGEVVAAFPIEGYPIALLLELCRDGDFL